MALHPSRQSLRVQSLALAVAVSAAPGAVSAQSRSLDLMHATVTDIQASVAAGTLTYERLVEMYLARIAAYEKQGPKLNAIIQVNPKAIEVARALDRERREKGLRSPLHGIPVAVKDVVDVQIFPRRAATSRWRAPSPPTTPPSSASCAKPARSSFSRPTSTNSTSAPRASVR
jgi:amidase